MNKSILKTGVNGHRRYTETYCSRTTSEQDITTLCHCDTITDPFTERVKCTDAWFKKNAEVEAFFVCE